MSLSAGWKRLGFRAKLIWVGVSLQVLMLAAVALGVSTLVDRYLQQELKARVGQLKPLFNAALAAPLAQRDFATVAAILAEARATRDLVFVCVRDASGRLIAEDRAGATPAVAGASELHKPAPAAGPQATLDFEAPLAMGGRCWGGWSSGCRAARWPRPGNRCCGRWHSSACFACWSSRPCWRPSAMP
jgi:hypothetical protein